MKVKEKKKYQKILIVIGCMALLVVYIFSITRVALQNDTFFDIKLGEKYIQGDFSVQDTFSIHEGLEYVSHHFMVNIITYLVYQYFGYMGLYGLLLLLTALLSLILYRVNKKFTTSTPLAYIAVFVELLILAPFLSVRAQMYSYLLFGLELLFIENYLHHGKKRYLVLLSLLPFVMANFHAGVLPFYYLIILCYICNQLRINFLKLEYDKEIANRVKFLWIAFFVGLVTMFCNPWGYRLILYTFQTLSNGFINGYIAEFQPATIHDQIGTWTFILGFTVLMAFLFTNKKIKWQHFLLCMGTLFMSLTAIRHLSLFVIVATTSLPYIEELIERGKAWSYKGLVENGEKYMRYIAYGFMLCLVLGYCGIKIYHKQYKSIDGKGYPVDSIAYIKENVPKEARIFNFYTWGSLLMKEGIPVFIDSRADLYTPEYNKGVHVANDYADAIECRKNYNEILKKYDIDYLLLKKDTPLAQNILDHDGQLLFEDDISYVIKYNKK